ncbi:hypothetical protein [Devosia sp. 1635]|uniref:hypothetical protein n=1 Tax=Devosia sp. 1635 TaxID=2726066 RepID=UPI0015677005|nr:hypothetical protein [Devosia sp. 1635]
MRLVVFGIVLLASCLPALSQQVVDESAKYVEPADLEMLFSTARDDLADGYSAKFSWLSKKRGYICGFVNAKNGFGAYSGNTAFRYEVSSRTLEVLPPANDALFGLKELSLRNSGCPTSI